MADATCSISGCTGRVRSKGWCAKHYGRWSRHGDPLTCHQPPRRACSVAECDRVHYALGWCNLHWSRHKRHGDPMRAAPPAQVGCKVDGCEKKHRSRGWCSMHYARWRVHGDPLAQVKPTSFASAADAFAHYTPKRDGCWPWQGNTNELGYGTLHHRDRSQLAHRLSWELHHGSIPAGMLVCHHCDNPPCVNPAHLFVGTNRDNVDDMHRKGRARPLRGSQHPASKLNEEAVRTIRQLSDEGWLQCRLAERYGVSAPLIAKVVRREIWTHVP